jgi:hypothetical protein
MTSVLAAPTDTPDIEFASRDRISTLQLKRLQWSAAAYLRQFTEGKSDLLFYVQH